jgi:hypothetical protein
MLRDFDNGIDRLETPWTFGYEEVILANSMAQIPVPRSKSGKAQRTLISILRRRLSRPRSLQAIIDGVSDHSREVAYELMRSQPRFRTFVPILQAARPQARRT